ncbi:hypothetical protein J2T13_002008 [Paenibacillus sp. DS2015]|uniref:hypothetical protein n=1 Tax=Paenibacillus sp. DS2015 TaxID=3373917 RepID=UPI003D1A38E5
MALKTWIFAGLCEKSDLLLYLCKLLASVDKRVLLVDATQSHKYPLYIGLLDKPLEITEFMNFDVACGFTSQVHLEEHLRYGEEKLERYDYVIYDVENLSFCAMETWRDSDLRVWTTDYGVWSLSEGSQWLNALNRQHSELKDMIFQLVYMHAVDTLLESSYIEDYVEGWPVCWEREPIIIPWDEMDMALKLENEHQRQLRMKPLSRRYKKALGILMKLAELDDEHIKRALRSAGRTKI